MIGGQRIQVGLPHAGKTAEVTVEAGTFAVRVPPDIIVTAARNSSREIRRHKAAHYPPGPAGHRDDDADALIRPPTISR